MKLKPGLLVFALLMSQASASLAQADAAASSPAGMSMLLLFLGIAAILAVFVARWSQSTSEDDDAA